ncbi:MAG: hypothetical protein ACOCZK_02795 [Planctomycetota bacterium]
MHVLREAILITALLTLVAWSHAADPLRLDGRPEALWLHSELEYGDGDPRQRFRSALTCSFALPRKPAMVGCHRMQVDQIVFDTGDVLRPHHELMREQRFHEHMLRERCFRVTLQIDPLPAEATRITHIRGSGQAMVTVGEQRVVRLAPVSRWLGKRVAVADIEGAVIQVVGLDGKRVALACNRAAHTELATIECADGDGTPIRSSGHTARSGNGDWMKLEHRLWRPLEPDGQVDFRFLAPTARRRFSFEITDVPVAADAVEPETVMPPRWSLPRERQQRRRGRMLRALSNAVAGMWHGSGAPADAEITTVPATRVQPEERPAAVVPVDPQAEPEASPSDDF